MLITTIIDVDDEQLNHQDETNDFPEEKNDLDSTANDRNIKIQAPSMNNDVQTTSGDLLLKGNPSTKDLVSHFRIISHTLYNIIINPFRMKVP